MTKELWVALVDTVGGLACYFAARYLKDEVADDVKFVWTTIQPLVLAFIAQAYIVNAVQMLAAIP